MLMRASVLLLFTTACGDMQQTSSDALETGLASIQDSQELRVSYTADPIDFSDEALFLQVPTSLFGFSFLLNQEFISNTDPVILPGLGYAFQPNVVVSGYDNLGTGFVRNYGYYDQAPAASSIFVERLDFSIPDNVQEDEILLSHGGRVFSIGKFKPSRASYPEGPFAYFGHPILCSGEYAATCVVRFAVDVDFEKTVVTPALGDVIPETALPFHRFSLEIELLDSGDTLTWAADNVFGAL